MPAAATELKHVAREAASCTRCPLYRHATQTVFGEGPARALIMLVGEQPGDQEDLAGRPFTEHGLRRMAIKRAARAGCCLAGDALELARGGRHGLIPLQHGASAPGRRAAL